MTMREVSSKLIRNFALVVITSASLWLALVSLAFAEVINNFVVDIEVQSNGQLLITENITYDFGKENRHGIYRNIKNQHAQEASAWFKDRYISFNLLSVSRNGQEEPYQLQDYQGLSVKIGDPDKTISGEHEYQIIYEVDGAIATYEEGHELYWNVTGTEWDLPINNVNVTVEALDESRLLSAQECYVGREGSSERCQSNLLSQRKAGFFAPELEAGEGMAIAQRLDLPETPTVLERVNAWFFWPIALLLWFVALLVWLWRWRFAHKESRSIIAQYEPYQSFKPMFTGVLFDNRLDNKDITAGLVYLAEQGFISIKQTEEKVFFVFETNDYEITLLRPVEEVETSFQKDLLSLLSLTTVDQSIKLSDLKKDTSQLKANAKTIKRLKKDVKEDLVELGFWEQRDKKSLLAITTTVVVMVGLFLLAAMFISLNSSLIAAGVLIIGTLLLVLAMGMERRTKLGYEALYHLKGFKDFLSTTDKERYKFHNAPSKSPQQFMEYLPYAIAFGVEKEWAEVFSDLHMDPPNWYSSSSHASFNAVAFSTEISSFSQALAGSSTPTGSGASGSGAVGGGSGGGGGGSW